MLRYLLVLLVILAGIPSFQQDIVINEMMSNNETTLADDQGDYQDWIEIFNAWNSTASLNGYFLSDNPSNLMKWAFPSVQIPPHSFLLVYASGRDTVVGSFIHTNFKINADGEWLFLTNGQSVIVDSLPPVDLEDDISFGRRPDGSEQLILFDMPTPGSSNNLSNSITFSHDRGYYTEPFDLSIFSDDAQATLRYTLDGSVPDQGSAIYSQPLLMGYRYGDPNTISMIPTTPDSAFLDSYHWKTPAGIVDKIHVLRVRSYIGDQPSSKVYSMSCMVDSLAYSRYPFPVMSVITDPDNLFDVATGIYVPGNAWIPEDPLWTGNYFQTGVGWEKPVHIELFRTDGSIEFFQEAGVRIHGKSTRRRPQKSLKFSARSSYGKSNFSYPLFPERDVDDYESFLLKNTFGCLHGTVIKDAMAHHLVRDLPFDVSSYRPVILFINGEYWGFQDMREDQDENYLTNLYDIDKDSLNILENEGNVLYGVGENYQALLAFIEQNDLALESNYDFVATQIDVGNYIDYNIAQVYLKNYDWPGSNIEYWQTPLLDNRWRWIFFDLDFAWGDATHNMLVQATEEGGSNWPNPDWSTFLFRNLLKNNTFKSQYINRFAELLNTLFQTDLMIGLIQEFTAQYEPVMYNHIQRHGYPVSVQAWQNTIADNLIKFAVDRPCIMEDHILEFFELEEFPFNCESNIDSCGEDFDFLIIPNPSDGNILIKTPFWQSVEVFIYDSQGHVIFMQEFGSAMADAGIPLNLNHLDNGMYFIRLNCQGRSSASKLIISK